MSAFVVNKGQLPKGGTGLPFFLHEDYATNCCLVDEIYTSVVNTLPPFQLWFQIAPNDFDFDVCLIDKSTGIETSLDIGGFVVNKVSDKDENPWVIVSYNKFDFTELGFSGIPCGIYCLKFKSQPLRVEYLSETFYVREKKGALLRWRHKSDFLNSIYYGNDYENCILLTCIEFTRPSITENATINVDGYGFECVSTRVLKERISFVLLATEAMLKTLYLIPSHDCIELDMIRMVGGNEVVNTVILKDVTVVDNGASSDCIHTVSIEFTSCDITLTNCDDSEFIVDG